MAFVTSLWLFYFSDIRHLRTLLSTHFSPSTAMIKPWFLNLFSYIIFTNWGPENTHLNTAIQTWLYIHVLKTSTVETVKLWMQEDWQRRDAEFSCFVSWFSPPAEEAILESTQCINSNYLTLLIYKKIQGYLMIVIRFEVSQSRNISMQKKKDAL